MPTTPGDLFGLHDDWEFGSIGPHSGTIDWGMFDLMNVGLEDIQGTALGQTFEDMGFQYDDDNFTLDVVETGTWAPGSDETTVFDYAMGEMFGDWDEYAVYDHVTGMYEAPHSGMESDMLYWDLIGGGFDPDQMMYNSFTYDDLTAEQLELLPDNYSSLSSFEQSMAITEIWDNMSEEEQSLWQSQNELGTIFEFFDNMNMSTWNPSEYTGDWWNMMGQFHGFDPSFMQGGGSLGGYSPPTVEELNQIMAELSAFADILGTNATWQEQMLAQSPGGFGSGGVMGGAITQLLNDMGMLPDSLYDIAEEELFDTDLTEEEIIEIQDYIESGGTILPEWLQSGLDILDEGLGGLMASEYPELTGALNTAIEAVYNAGGTTLDYTAAAIDTTIQYLVAAGVITADFILPESFYNNDDPTAAWHNLVDYINETIDYYTGDEEQVDPYDEYDDPALIDLTEEKMEELISQGGLGDWLSEFGSELTSEQQEFLIEGGYVAGFDENGNAYFWQSDVVATGGEFYTWEADIQQQFIQDNWQFLSEEDRAFLFEQGFTFIDDYDEMIGDDLSWEWGIDDEGNVEYDSGMTDEEMEDFGEEESTLLTYDPLHPDVESGAFEEWLSDNDITLTPEMEDEYWTNFQNDHAWLIEWDEYIEQLEAEEAYNEQATEYGDDDDLIIPDTDDPGDVGDIPEDDFYDMDTPDGDVDPNNPDVASGAWDQWLIEVVQGEWGLDMDNLPVGVTLSDLWNHFMQDEVWLDEWDFDQQQQQDESLYEDQYVIDDEDMYGEFDEAHPMVESGAFNEWMAENGYTSAYDAAGPGMSAWDLFLTDQEWWAEWEANQADQEDLTDIYDLEQEIIDEMQDDEASMEPGAGGWYDEYTGESITPNLPDEQAWFDMTDEQRNEWIFDNWNELTDTEQGFLLDAGYAAPNYEDLNQDGTVDSYENVINAQETGDLTAVGGDINTYIWDNIDSFTDEQLQEFQDAGVFLNEFNDSEYTSAILDNMDTAEDQESWIAENWNNLSDEVKQDLVDLGFLAGVDSEGNPFYQSEADDMDLDIPDPDPLDDDMSDDELDAFGDDEEEETPEITFDENHPEVISGAWGDWLDEYGLVPNEEDIDALWADFLADDEWYDKWVDENTEEIPFEPDPDEQDFDDQDLGDTDLGGTDTGDMDQDDDEEDPWDDVNSNIDDDPDYGGVGSEGYTGGEETETGDDIDFGEGGDNIVTDDEGNVILPDNNSTNTDVEGMLNSVTLTGPGGFLTADEIMQQLIDVGFGEAEAQDFVDNWLPDTPDEWVNIVNEEISLAQTNQQIQFETQAEQSALNYEQKLEEMELQYDNVFSDIDMQVEQALLQANKMRGAGFGDDSFIGSGFTGYDEAYRNVMQKAETIRDQSIAKYELMKTQMEEAYEMNVQHNQQTFYGHLNQHAQTLGLTHEEAYQLNGLNANSQASWLADNMGENEDYWADWIALNGLIGTQGGVLTDLDLAYNTSMQRLFDQYESSVMSRITMAMENGALSIDGIPDGGFTAFLQNNLFDPINEFAGNTWDYIAYGFGDDFESWYTSWDLWG